MARNNNNKNNNNKGGGGNKKPDNPPPKQQPAPQPAAAKSSGGNNNGGGNNKGGNGNGGGNKKADTPRPEQKKSSNWSQEGSGLTYEQWQTYQANLEKQKKKADSGQQRKKLRRRIDAAGNVIEEWVTDPIPEPVEPTPEPEPDPDEYTDEDGDGLDDDYNTDIGTDNPAPLPDTMPENYYFDEWANQTDREAAYRRHLMGRLGIDTSLVDSDYAKWLSDQFQSYDELYRVSIGDSYAKYGGQQLGAEEEIVVGSDGERYVRKKGAGDKSQFAVADLNRDGEVNDADIPQTPDYWDWMNKYVTADRVGTNSDPYKDWWANRNQDAYFLNSLGSYGYDPGGEGQTRNEYQQWLSSEAFRPFAEGYTQAAQSDPNLQFRKYLESNMAGADLGQEGDAYQDYWGDRNQSEKFTNWARSQGVGQIDDASNPYTRFLQGEGGMGKLQRTWNQNAGGMTWNDFLKDQDVTRFQSDFMKSSRTSKGRAGSTFGSGPGRWSTFG